MALPVFLPIFFRSKCGDLHLGHSEFMGNPFWMVKAGGRFGFGYAFRSDSESGLRGMALWLHRFWGWPSALLLASDFSDVLGEHQDGENTACEGDKESS